MLIFSRLLLAGAAINAAIIILGALLILMVSGGDMGAISFSLIYGVAGALIIYLSYTNWTDISECVSK